MRSMIALRLPSSPLILACASLYSRTVSRERLRSLSCVIIFFSSCNGMEVWAWCSSSLEISRSIASTVKNFSFCFIASTCSFIRSRMESTAMSSLRMAFRVSIWAVKEPLSSVIRARVPCVPALIVLRESRLVSILRFNSSILAWFTSQASCRITMVASSSVRSGFAVRGLSGLGTTLAGAAAVTAGVSVGAGSTTLASAGDTSPSASAAGTASTTGATSAWVVMVAVVVDHLARVIFSRSTRVWHPEPIPTRREITEARRERGSRVNSRG
mmetsp:Transcript_39559/g.63450  ORF Transcript_39559/g.63450 Transcript_39559/m.63450 type:complete len:271 (+) Transcript_39559:1354-2166(+)